jgi:hypothetical protein
MPVVLHIFHGSGANSYSDRFNRAKNTSSPEKYLERNATTMLTLVIGMRIKDYQWTGKRSFGLNSDYPPYSFAFNFFCQNFPVFIIVWLFKFPFLR